MKLVDTADLKSADAERRRAGSSPALGTRTCLIFRHSPSCHAAPKANESAIRRGGQSPYYRAAVAPSASGAPPSKPLRTSAAPDALLFPGFSRGGALSENALLALLARAGYFGRQTAHGFRASFSTWAHEVREGRSGCD